MYPPGTNFADISTFSAHFEQKIGKRRHKTSHDVTWPNFEKCCENVPFHNILLLQKFEVNWIFLPKLWQLTFFSSLSGDIGGNAIYLKFDHLTMHNFWTTYRKKVIDPSLESPGIFLYWKRHLKPLSYLVFAYVSIFSAIVC